MSTLLLALDAIVKQGEGMIVRRYGKKYGDGGMFFNAFICLFATVFFLFTDKGGLCFPKELWVYGIISCLMFATGFYTMYLAMQIGSYVGTRMFSGFSVIFPMFYGIFFLKEPSSVTTVIAFILIFLSIFLRTYQKNDDTNKGATPVRWYIYLFLSAVSNGFISIISRMQQIRFDNSCDNEFMIISFAGSALFLFVMGYIKEREKFKKTAKYSLLYGAGAGLLNGAVNLLGLMLYLYLPISVSLPLRQGIGFLLSFLVAKFLYKETFTKREIAALIVGAAAIILFKI